MLAVANPNRGEPLARDMVRALSLEHGRGILCSYVVHTTVPAVVCPIRKKLWITFQTI